MYNKEQLEIINSDSPNLAVIAPPGSGKTKTMIGAVEKYIKENPASDKIVVITFTNAAVQEIIERLTGYRSRVEVSTIHSWSYRELIKLSEKYYFRVRLLEEDRILEILRPIILEYFPSTRYERVILSFCMGNVNLNLNRPILEKYQAIKNKYVAYKQKMNLYDFTDLPLYLHNELEKRNETITLDALFVDEFQDVDETQLNIFNRVIAEKKFFIGDPDQSIYLFRGAAPEVFDKLVDFDVKKLKTNYRSHQEIIDFAYRNKLTVYNDEKVLAEKKWGGTIYHNFYDTSWYEIKPGKSASRLADTEDIISEIVNNDYQFLCRTNKIADTLRDMGFYNATTIHQSKGLEYDNVCLVVSDSFEEITEESNIAFVGMTRARKKLIVGNIESVLKILTAAEFRIKQNSRAF